MKPIWIDGPRAFAALLAAGLIAAAIPTRAAVPAAGTRVLRGAPTPGSMGVPQPEPLITLKMSQKSLSRILAEMFKQTSYKYDVQAELGAAVFAIDVDRVPLSQALRGLLAQDKGELPLVFSFVKDPTGTTGTFLVNREYMEIGIIDGESKLSVANARVTHVLPKVFEQLKKPYRIEPDVPPVLISLILRPDDWTQVVPQVILEAEKTEPTLTYSMDGDTYVIHLQKTPIGGTAGAPARRVKMSVANAPLKTVLEELFRDSAWKYEVNQKVAGANVTFNSVNDPELAALRSILRLASVGPQQLTYREGKGILYIEPGPLPGDVRVTARQQTARDLVTLQGAKDLSLKLVLDSIERQAGVKITKPPTLPDLLPVTVKVKDVPVEDALQAVIEALGIPNLRFRASGKEYTLVLGNGG